MVSNNFSIELMKRRRRAWSVNAHLHVVAVCRHMGTVSKICGTAGNVSYSCLCLSCCWSFSLAPAIEKTEVTQRTLVLFFLFSLNSVLSSVLLDTAVLSSFSEKLPEGTRGHCSFMYKLWQCTGRRGRKMSWSFSSLYFLLLFKSVGCYTCMLVSLRYQHGTGLVAYRCSKKLYRSTCICL